MENLLKTLNAEQRQAVELGNEHALILAGAGSGKTRVLTTRISYLLATRRAQPHNILAVTFTNKAAREMAGRVADMCGMGFRNMWIGTFHGLCNRILRLHHEAAGLTPGFTIMDSGDQTTFMRRLMKKNGVNEDEYVVRDVLGYINRLKEQGIRAKDAPVPLGMGKGFAELYRMYESACETAGVVDFAELMVRCCELLERNQPVREHYRERFTHILVDEFQDTNDIQYRWIKLMCGKDSCVFAVGDDDQSIYAFRGANVGNMRSFLEEFRVGSVIRLEQNYRSSANILAAANKVIENNPERLGKNLRTAGEAGERVTVYEAPTDVGEAEWIADEIRRRVNQAGIDRKEIAILYRSNAQSRVFEQVFLSRGLPYKMTGSLRFFERAEIKNAMAYLQLILNPANNGAFLRAVNTPPRGIGEKSIEALEAHAAATNTSLFGSIGAVATRSASALGRFKAVIDDLTEMANELSLSDLIIEIIDKSTLKSYYELQRTEEALNRLENLQQLVEAADFFVQEAGVGRDTPAMVIPEGDDWTLLESFISNAALDSGEADTEADVNRDAVNLMTVHAAKGLEFDAVFVSGMEEGLFPHRNAAETEGGLEEERRLMYVAMTRARKFLTLTRAQTRMLYGTRLYSSPSAFLDELPAANIYDLSEKPTWRKALKTGAYSGKDFSSSKPSFAQRQQSGGAAQKKPVTLGKEVYKTEKKTPDGKTWKAGQRVSHAKFGTGVIIATEGSNDAPRAHVKFDKAGVKLLDLTIAKLDKL